MTKQRPNEMLTREFERRSRQAPRMVLVLLLGAWGVGSGCLACNPNLREGADHYRCQGETLETLFDGSHAPVPCQANRVCADSLDEALQVAGRKCSYSVFSCELVKKNGC